MKTCPSCNQTNPVVATFCQKCASPLGAAQNYPQPAPPPQQFGNQPFNQPNFGNPGIPPQNIAQISGGASSRAMLAAGLAVFGFCCCFVGGIPAALLGWLEISAIKEGKSSAEGMTMAQVGLWLGIGGTLINAIGWGIFALFGSVGGGY